MPRKHLVAVGACYVDTILDVPHYPREDEKLRATALIKRRGGNCPNSLEVLQQLVAVDDSVPKKVVADLPGDSTVSTQAAANGHVNGEEGGGGGSSSRDDVQSPAEQTPLSAYVTPPDTREDTAAADTSREANAADDDEEMLDPPVMQGNESRTYKEKTKDDTVKKESSLSLTLISTLPRRSSAASGWIVNSFDTFTRDANAEGNVQNERQTTSIDLSHCIYREEHYEPASSYILSSNKTHTRTIVNINELPEMTTEEFIAVCEELFRSNTTADTTVENNKHAHTSAAATTTTQVSNEEPDVWHFHFEGRIPDTTLQCIRWLKAHNRFRTLAAQTRTHAQAQSHLRISVELEKPNREGLQLLADEADIIFYSKTWAQAAGYKTPELCVWDQHCRARVSADPTGAEKLFICTWGVAGARAVSMHKSRMPGRGGGNGGDDQPVPVIEVLESFAFYSQEGRPVKDSVGAGDTFIAGVLWGLLCREREGEGGWSMQQVLDFANQLAGRKVLQWGFDRLGTAMRGIINPDEASSREIGEGRAAQD